MSIYAISTPDMLPTSFGYMPTPTPILCSMRPPGPLWAPYQPFNVDVDLDFWNGADPTIFFGGYSIGDGKTDNEQGKTSGYGNKTSVKYVYELRQMRTKKIM